MKCVCFLLINFSFFTPLAINAQIEVKTMNPDGTPNSNCYFSVDSVQIGLTNRNGSVFINQSLKGEEVVVSDIGTGWEDRFYLNSDTTIVVEDVQTLSEVEIKPRNTKKLYKEIMELNQNRLPGKLNLKGDVFFAELYIIRSERPGGKTDTILDVFSCEVIIMDVFGNRTILAKNPIKYMEGSTSNVVNEERFTKLENLIIPHKNRIKNIRENLNYDIFEMKKFRKYNSSLNIDDRNWQLKFYKQDSTKAFGVMEKEFLYSWKKKDSSLVHVSSFFRMGDKSSKQLSLPFGYRELSNPNLNYSDSHILSEEEVRMMNEEQHLSLINNVFKYFDIERRIDDNANIHGFKEVQSFEDLYNETKTKKPDEDIIPVLYPLRFPVSIFFD